MALCPFAEKRLIRPGSNDPPIDVIGAILHVDAGNADSLFGYFNGPSGGIESHFHIKRDGTIEQYRNTGYEADANYKANSFYVGDVRKGFASIETQGYGEGEWTAEQLASLKRLLAWLSGEHHFPLRKTPGPFESGVGFHTLFPSLWTPYAKSCPGADRIVQFNNVLLPWMGDGGTTTEEEDPMAGMSPAAIFKTVWSGGKIRRAGGDEEGQRPAEALWRAEANARHANANARTALAAVRELLELEAQPELSTQERARLAKQIARLTAENVARLDLEDVAARLDVVVVPIEEE